MMEHWRENSSTLQLRTGKPCRLDDMFTDRFVSRTVKAAADQAPGKPNFALPSVWVEELFDIRKLQRLDV